MSSFPIYGSRSKLLDRYCYEQSLGFFRHGQRRVDHGRDMNTHVRSFGSVCIPTMWLSIRTFVTTRGTPNGSSRNFILGNFTTSTHDFSVLVKIGKSGWALHVKNRKHFCPYVEAKLSLYRPRQAPRVETLRICRWSARYVGLLVSPRHRPHWPSTDIPYNRFC